MKPIEELASGRGPSERTMREVQLYTARATIEAARRAVKDGTAGDFERDLMLTLANVDSFEFRITDRTAEVRRKAQEQGARVRAEAAADAEARAEAELQRHVQASPEIEATASEFLARFTPPSQEKH